VPFDITDEKFAAAYLDVLHHPQEDIGVDFWWIDWQQGELSDIPGVDPLWVLNFLHFIDSARDGRRGLTFSRYAGPGSHRYPIGFSGDTIITWASLRFQPEFTATASNIGYGWWSHDIGGHLHGVRDDLLTVRWAQLGVFSPINRLHSSSNPFLQKEPWAYPRQARDAIGAALRFRHRLVPYLHSMNHRAAHGEPLVQPMYYGYPSDSAAYEVPRQFLFGDSLLVAPITDPDDAVTLLGSTRVWLPEGRWADIFTGAVYTAGPGGRHLTLHRDDRSIPALVPAGAVLPLAGAATHADANPAALELVLLAGADGTRELVEDDGTGSRPEDIPTARTVFAWDDAGRTLTIHAAAGDRVAPARRTWTIRFLGLGHIDSVDVDVDGLAAEIGPSTVTLADVPTGADVRITVHAARAVPPPDKRPRLFDLLARAQWDHVRKWEAWKVIDSGAGDLDKIAQLQALGLPGSLLSALTEIVAAE
jgi:alpha-glucosidase (family GH31 glycosyl hydrolase)